ncbi:MAG: EamA family transporter [Eggerthellaceae bacterium]|nr:EamA family transporter [Eggerthellaceae bacterium]
MILYVLIYLAGVFIAAVSQVMLKKAAQREYESVAKEYLNPLVIFAYVLFFATTLMTIFAYKEVPLTYGPILESASYIFVTIFGVTIFKESFGWKKGLALALIIIGILVFSFGV